MFSFLYLKFTKNITMKILFYILFASTATSLAQRDPPINYDITTLLNNSIAKSFRNLDPDLIQELINNMENDHPTSYDTGVNYDSKPFQNEFYFTGVAIKILKFETVHVRHVFPSAEMTVFLPKLSIKIKGYLGATNNTVHAGFLREVHFENVSIVAFKLPHHIPQGKLYIYMKYEENFESNCIYEPWFHRDIKLEARLELERKIKQMLPLLFLDNLQHNEKFLRTINATFCNHPKKEITSLYPDFEQNTQQYHYIIPNITSLQRTLSNITITRMWNFRSHSFSVHVGQIVTNLIIKDIRGYANLYYGSQNSAIFPLRFQAGFISILVEGEMERVSVTAYNYSVSQINLNSSLNEHQSKWVMEGIELAIASSIMPSIEVYRDRNELSNGQREHPIFKISTKMSQQFQGSTIQKLYHDWNISMPENITAESNLQLESSIYNISICSTPTRPFTPSPYPNWIQCNLYDKLQASFGLPWYLFGKIRLTNSTHQFDDIDFMMGDIFGEVIKRNNSKEHDDFEFCITSEKGIEVLLESDLRNFTQNQLQAIIQKTKQMLTSSILEILKALAKPLLSLSLDHCTAPVTMFDDFLPFFANHELPYYVPNYDNRSNDKFFMSKMNNIVIEKWTIPSIWISFYYSNDENLSSIVNMELGNSRILMSLNDSSVQSNESQWEFVFSSTALKNFTDTGEIAAHLHYDRDRYPVQNNLSSSARESYWLKYKLEYIIADSFKNLIY